MKTTKNKGFTLVELLIAVAITSVMGMAIIGASVLLMRGTQETTKKMDTQMEFDTAAHTIYNLLINTEKSQIEEIIATSTAPDAIGTGIIFQVPTPNSSGEYTSNGLFHWGDGQTEGNYIRIREDENNDIVFERVDTPNSTTPIEKKILLRNCSMQIRGAFINNNGNLEYNNAAPAILDIVMEKENKYFNAQPYRKHLHITLRVH